MTIQRHMSLKGFIDNDPDLQFSESGAASFSARFGVLPICHRPGGSTTDPDLLIAPPTEPCLSRSLGSDLVRQHALA